VQAELFIKILQRLILLLKKVNLSKEKELLNAFKYAKDHHKNIHLLGLVSNGGIHSHSNHVKGLLDAANDHDIKNIFLHAFTDGRDCDPKSGSYFINDIQDHMKKNTCELATLTGRYYEMDRDKRWERGKLA